MDPVQATGIRLIVDLPGILPFVLSKLHADLIFFGGDWILGPKEGAPWTMLWVKCQTASSVLPLPFLPGGMNAPGAMVSQGAACLPNCSTQSHSLRSGLYPSWFSLVGLKRIPLPPLTWSLLKQSQVFWKIYLFPKLSRTVPEVWEIFVAHVPPGTLLHDPWTRPKLAQMVLQTPVHAPPRISPMDSHTFWITSSQW